MSNQNIKPYYWGSKLWSSTYTLIAAFPDKPDNDHIHAIQNFFKSWIYLIPCYSCRNSYCIYIKEDDTNINDLNNFSSKNKLIEFVFNLKNKVNNKITIEYYVSLQYFKKKMEKLLSNDNHLSYLINNLLEAPFIQKNIKHKVYDYMKKKSNYDVNYTIDITNRIKKFMDNPIFAVENKTFKLLLKRNYKCRKIIKNIYLNMSEGNYSLNDSFIKNNDLHLQLFYLGCSIIPIYDLEKLIK